MSQRSAQQFSRTSNHQGVEEAEESSDGDSDDWRDIQDATERRRRQNRIAQRRFREKVRAACEESTLRSINEAAAANAYSQPDPAHMAPDNGHSGLPWGGVSIRHVVQQGQTREEQSRRRHRDAAVSWPSSEAVAYDYELEAATQHHRHHPKQQPVVPILYGQMPSRPRRGGTDLTAQQLGCVSESMSGYADRHQHQHDTRAQRGRANEYLMPEDARPARHGQGEGAAGGREDKR